MRTVLALVGIMGLGTSAVAQPAPTAETLFNEAQAAYLKGDFATAVARWQASYKASGEPELLFDIAQAMRQNNQCKESLFTYRRFVALAPTADKRSDAEQFIRELEPQCGVAPTQAPARDEPPIDMHRIERIGGIATAGTGAILLLSGLIVGSHASSLGDEVSKACTPAVPCDWDVYGPKDASGRHDATVGRVLDVLGLAALAGGAALYYLGSRAPEIAVVPVAAPHDAGAVLTWRRVW